MLVPPRLKDVPDTLSTVLHTRRGGLALNTREKLEVTINPRYLASRKTDESDAKTLSPSSESLNNQPEHYGTQDKIN